jgi:hypothetical protein
MRSLRSALSRFDELLPQLDEFVEKRKRDPMSYDIGDHVEAASFLGWCVNARNLPLQACGAESEHYKGFHGIEKHYGQAQLTGYQLLLGLRAVLQARKERTTRAGTRLSPLTRRVCVYSRPQDA